MKRKDYTLKIVPAYTNNPEDKGKFEEMLQVVLYTAQYKTGKTFPTPRERVVLDEDDIDKLLRGELSGDEGLKELERIAGKVSQWLLKEDLGHALDLVLSEMKNEQMRLIFTVDDRLGSMFDLATVPVELIRNAPAGGGSEYALSPKIAAFLHVLEKVGDPPRNTEKWPLRVLLVRSDPKDLFEAVPLALPISNNIKAKSGLGPRALQINVLSREEGIGRPATWKALRNEIRNNSYHILIYLGHADLKQEANQLVGFLQMESEDGEGHQNVAGRFLKTELENNAVPVVMMVGCLTAAQRSKLEDEDRQDLDAIAMQTIRASHGLAQTLINSGSSVQVAIGMRYRLWSEDARSFLESFFESLLKGGQKGELKGNVEAAVQYARRELYNSTYCAAYSAPVIFRAVQDASKDEPIFKFLKEDPPQPPPEMPGVPPPAAAKAPDPALVERWKARAFIWDDLQSISLGARQPVTVEEKLRDLKRIEQQLMKDTSQQAALIMTEFVLAKPKDTVTVTIRLHDLLEGVTSLKGKLTVDRADVVIKDVAASPQLAVHGYKLDEVKVDEGELTFSIKPTLIGGGTLLPESPLFQFQMQLGPNFPVRYSLVLSEVETVPPRDVYPGTNVVLVPPP